MRGILCFGDSITFGNGEDSNKGWCGRLKDYAERKNSSNEVYNLGIPGDSTKGLLERLEIETKSRIITKNSLNKYLIIISIGINDSLVFKKPELEDNQKISKEFFRKNIRKLILKSKSFKTSTIFINLLPIKEIISFEEGKIWYLMKRVKLFNEIIKEECEKGNVLIFDIFQKMIKEDYLKLLKDGLHPNSKGYDFIFKELKNFLLKNNYLT